MQKLRPKALALSLALLAVLGAQQPARAEPLQLHCKGDEFANGFNIVVNVEEGYIVPAELAGIPELRSVITEVSHNFITATDAFAWKDDPNTHHGGEVFVLNRNTGRFIRAGVGLNCAREDCEAGSETPMLFVGICTRRLE